MPVGARRTKVEISHGEGAFAQPVIEVRRIEFLLFKRLRRDLKITAIDLALEFFYRNQFANLLQGSSAGGDLVEELLIIHDESHRLGRQ